MAARTPLGTATRWIGAATLMLFAALTVAPTSAGALASGPPVRLQFDDPSCPEAASGVACTYGSGGSSSTTSSTSTTVPPTSEVTSATSSSTSSSTTSEVPATVLGATTVAGPSSTTVTATVLGAAAERQAGALAQTGSDTAPLTLFGAALVVVGALLMAVRSRRGARADYSSTV